MKNGVRRAVEMKKLIRRVVVLIILAALVVGGVYTYKGYSMYKSALKKTGIEEMVEGIKAEDDYVSFEELPKTYINAVVAVEDHRFYSHGPIDVLAIGRALWNNLKSQGLLEGGSTITQQLAKNLYFTQKKTLERKIAEMFMARDFERLYGKKTVLELYVNTIYFGSGYYCVYDASEGYFGVKPQKMTDYQSTMLAGIPNAPSVYSLDSSPKLASQRQKQVLEKMVRYGYISQDESTEILNSGDN
jgi:membrane peptidoglycan carboxypeptidase